MSKEELITRQQLEIEGLKKSLSKCADIAKSSHNDLIYVQQWSISGYDFPSMSMNMAVVVSIKLEEIIDEVMTSE